MISSFCLDSWFFTMNPSKPSRPAPPSIQVPYPANDENFNPSWIIIQMLMQFEVEFQSMMEICKTEKEMNLWFQVQTYFQSKLSEIHHHIAAFSTDSSEAPFMLLEEITPRTTARKVEQIKKVRIDFCSLFCNTILICVLGGTKRILPDTQKVSTSTRCPTLCTNSKFSSCILAISSSSTRITENVRTIF